MTRRAAIARATCPIVWRRPQRAARMLHAFARAEQASRIDLQLAATATPSAARAALYLRHAADESRHARMFSKRAAELQRAAGRDAFGAVRADVEHLFARLGETLFLAFVHLGERSGRAQFEAYHAYFDGRGDRTMAGLFETVLADERRHEAYTMALLVEVAGGERHARAALRRAAMWRAWRSWRRAGRALAHAAYAGLVTVVFIASAPLALLVRLVRPARGGLRDGPEARIEWPPSSG